jgi:hypothetical protein
MKPLMIMALIALFAVMTLSVSGIGPVAAQACGTEKGPPPG